MTVEPATKVNKKLRLKIVVELVGKAATNVNQRSHGGSISTKQTVLDYYELREQNVEQGAVEGVINKVARGNRCAKIL